MRSSPNPSRRISGARPGSTPSSPSYIGRATKSVDSSSTARSGVTMMHWRCRSLALAMELLPFARQALGLLGRFLDAADPHELLLGQVVPLAVAQLLEAADGFGQRRHLAGPVGEGLGDDERLRQEALDPPCPRPYL